MGFGLIYHRSFVVDPSPGLDPGQAPVLSAPGARRSSCLHVRHSPRWPQASPLPPFPIRHWIAQLEGEALTPIFLASLLILKKCR